MASQLPPGFAPSLLGQDPAAMTGIVMSVSSPAAMSRMARVPAFSDVAYALLDGWAPHSDDSRAMSRKILDLGHYSAGVWAIWLAATPGGLTATRLGQLLGDTRLGSRSRAYALIVYLQAIRFVEAIPGAGGYRPTAALIEAYTARFERELTTAAPLGGAIAEVLDRWREPGVSHAFLVANGAYLAGALKLLDPQRDSLSAISHRRAGLTLLGQIISRARRAGEGFPPAGPFRGAIADLARLAEISRAQAHHIVKDGRRDGLFQTPVAGELHWGERLREGLVDLVCGYLVSLDWCAAVAISRPLTDDRPSPGETRQGPARAEAAPPA